MDALSTMQKEAVAVCYNDITRLFAGLDWRLVEIFTKAIAWVEDESVLRGAIRSVEYRASW